MNKLFIGFGVFAFFVFGAALYNSQKQIIHPPASSTVTSTIMPTQNFQKDVPLPLASDIVRSFFTLIDQKRASEAVMFMTSTITNDDSVKQAWGVQLNAIQSAKLVEVIPLVPESVQAQERTYKVTFDAIIDPSSASAPIPYYGYDNGKNTRWITLIKEGKMWRITGLATGP